MGGGGKGSKELSVRESKTEKRGREKDRVDKKKEV